MVDTAAALHDINDKTIILTGALQPRSMRHSDAAFNIGLALGALPWLPHGTYIAINGQVQASHRVRKDLVLGRFVTLD
jgi:L-asparaginase